MIDSTKDIKDFSPILAEFSQIVNHVMNHLHNCPDCECKFVDVLCQLEMKKIVVESTNSLKKETSYAS